MSPGRLSFVIPHIDEVSGLIHSWPRPRCSSSTSRWGSSISDDQQGLRGADVHIMVLLFITVVIISIVVLIVVVGAAPHRRYYYFLCGRPWLSFSFSSSSF